MSIIQIMIFGPFLDISWIFQMVVAPKEHLMIGPKKFLSKES